MTCAKFTSDYLYGYWATSPDQFSSFWFFFFMCLGASTSQIIGLYGRVCTAQLFTWRAGKKLHNQMIERVLKAPVNLYFDVTPIGRILNKFSKDLNATET